MKLNKDQNRRNYLLIKKICRHMNITIFHLVDLSLVSFISWFFDIRVF